MKRINQISFIIILFLFYSCGGINKSVEGFWTIDKIEYKNQDLLFDIKANIIIFKSKKCVLPYINGTNFLKAYSEEGVWEIVKNNNETYSIKIETKNEIFLGTHQICFKKDFENKLIKMLIHSDSLYIECRKGLFDFDKDNSSIDDYMCK